MSRALCVAALLAPASLIAQPFSESMADCASLHQIMAQAVESDAAADRLMFGAQQWHAAALRQRRIEGDAVTAQKMWAEIDAKSDATEAKGLAYLFSEDFRDWTNYCRSFANNQGITLTP